MTATLDKIFAELDEIAELAGDLRARQNASARQTDLEVSILRRQNDELRANAAAADKLVASALEILK
ncbi:MAG: hypothetical protein LBR41_02515 [Rickettsiales bacterium]|jgi:hypothetical protein|nr:hypothetical protein [Rickettsiales bacterium]